MNWDAIGAVAEAIGSIGVLISLFYLAMQIRQNTRQISSSIEANRLSAFERNTESGNRIRELFILHPEVAELYHRGNTGLDALQGAERIRYEMLVRNIFSSIQGAYIRQLSVAHDPAGTEGMARIIDEILSSAGVCQFLDCNRPDWRPEFEEFVRERLARIKADKEYDQ